MHNADLITPQHLARKAVIYIRQSTPHQVLSHQESLRLQYALGARAHQLGWPDEAIDIIDDDLGLTAATAHHRPGFNTLVAQVTLEQVGLILSYDVTRLSRNCSDWYPLLDLCGYKGCLIADGDGIYDPATVNGRLLLGLKGTLSEWERHTMKARLTAGLGYVVDDVAPLRLQHVADGDLGPLVREDHRLAPPHAARPTGDERNLARQSHGDLLWSRRS